MSTKNGEMVLPAGIGPTLEIPDAAPMPHFDLNDPELSLIDVFAPNFFNGQTVTDIYEESGEWPSFTVVGVNIEPIYNGREDKDGKKTEFKPVLSFAETAVRLVLNVTRATVVSRFVRSKRIADFATVGTVELSVPGGLNAKGEGEIVLRVIPPAHGKGRQTGQSVDEVNEELFG
jgi:hypothetical protein